MKYRENEKQISTFPVALILYVFCIILGGITGIAATCCLLS